jgi:hypothetical protein
MKATLKNMMLAYSGKCDGLVYYYNPRLERVLVRTIPKMKITENNRRLGRIASNLKALGLSEGFRLDLLNYTELYRREYRDSNCTSWYNLFLRMMWALAKSENIDLEALTREQINAQNLPCASVKKAIDAGLLMPVPGYERMDSLM